MCVHLGLLCMFLRLEIVVKHVWILTEVFQISSLCLLEHETSCLTVGKQNKTTSTTMKSDWVNCKTWNKAGVKEVVTD